MSVVFASKTCYTIDDLVEIVMILRGENGCEWDKEQTHQSLRGAVIEEAYELVEAIDCNDPEMMKEELGDLLLHVALHANIGAFTFDEVCDSICRKMMIRHPHVFGDVTAKSVDEILTNWDNIKMQSKGQSSVSETLSAVPEVFPSLMRCQKLQKRASKSTLSGISQDKESALSDLKKVIARLDATCLERDIAQVLFEVTNLARLNDVETEQSLSDLCRVYTADFTARESNEKR